MKTLFLTFILFFLFCAAGSAQDLNKTLRDELLLMRDADQRARRECAQGNAEEQIKCLIKTAETIDRPNTARLAEIFAREGFPTVKMVGKEGVDAFMLLLQHATDERLREKCLKPISKAFARGEIAAPEYANFVDRLRVRQGKPQIYGSNFDIRDGKLVMSKTRDLKNLDRRRQKIGLPPLAEYVKMLKDFYKLEVELPASS